jgi:Mini-chromosome maintenance replisome factor
MVQDMLDAEYFPTITANRRSRRRNHHGNGDHDFVPNADLAERTPLIVVPIPGSRSTMAPKLGTVEQQRQEHRDKRHKQQQERLDRLNSTGEEMRGTRRRMGTDPAEAVLAKFYHDQYPTVQQQRRPKLNQLVQMIGVLGDVDDDDDDDVAMTMMDFGGGYEPDVALHVPTTLHVLWFRSTGLEEENDADRSTADLSTTAATGTTAPLSVPQHPGSLLSRALGIPVAGGDDGDVGNNDNDDDVVGRSLWTMLQSKAERDQHECLMVTPHDTVLGCASLNLILSSSFEEEEKEEDLRGIQQTLLALLRQLVPVLQTVTVTPESLEEQLLVPSKQAGRLVQAPLQLPPGSVVVLDVTRFQSGRLSAHQMRNWQVLQNLCTGHRIPYRFDGDVEIPFEADYRVLVLSSRSTHKLLPCTLTARIPSSASTCMMDNSCTKNNDNNDIVDSIAVLKQMLQRCRTIGNVGLEDSVLERAQRDFLDRRRWARETTNEAAFHRWLTLTRLQARSRCSSAATVEDWERALLLDDAMQKSIKL